MADTLTLTIQLSPETREFVRKRIERGEYISEAELASQSVESLMNDAERLEHRLWEPIEDELTTWEHEVIGPIYDRMKADPSRAIASEEVHRHLEERRRLRGKSA